MLSLALSDGMLYQILLPLEVLALIPDMHELRSVPLGYEVVRIRCILQLL